MQPELNDEDQANIDAYYQTQQQENKEEQATPAPKVSLPRMQPRQAPKSSNVRNAPPSTPMATKPGWQVQNPRCGKAQNMMSTPIQPR